MTQVPGVCTVYNVSLTPKNQVRLEMIIKAGSFPDFAVDLDVATAERIGRVMLAMADLSYRRAGAPAPTHVSQSVEHG
jgi:hypothetical protein